MQATSLTIWNVRLIVLMAYSMLLPACTSLPEKQFYYNEIAVRNKANISVKNVTILVPITRSVFSCGYIAPGTYCSNKIKKRKYQGNPIKISWEFNGNKRITEEFVLELPASLQEDIPFRGVLEITPNGSIRTYVEQDKQ